MLISPPGDPIRRPFHIVVYPALVTLTGGGGVPACLPAAGPPTDLSLWKKMRWLRGETNCLSQSCAIQIVVVFVSLPTCVPMLLRSSPQEAMRTGRTHSTHLRPFAKQSGATCAAQRPLTSAPPSFRAVTRKHLGARRGRPPGRPRGVKRCPEGENAPF